MSAKTLPLLFINLGGEMLYILDQRLKAQSIPLEKAKRVMNDIVGTMLNKRFMEQLFEPQELYSKKAVRTVFDRLAHASIMRLNAASMDKLYDLMTMAFKYQVSLCLRPQDILLITLNHMDAIRKFVDGTGTIIGQVEYVYGLIIRAYASLSVGEFMLVRQTLMTFFQDMHIRVSIFLKDQVQSSNGRFVLPTTGQVPHGSELPGSIKLFDGSGRQVKVVTFTCGSSYKQIAAKGGYDIQGNRVTKLGTNMYAVSRVEATVTRIKTIHSSDLESAVPDPLAKAQLDLLSSLLRSGKAGEKKSEFRLNLFNTDEEEEEAAVMRPPDESGSQFITIDARKKKGNAELDKIMGEMTVASSGNHQADKGDDLLELMDGL